MWATKLVCTFFFFTTLGLSFPSWFSIINPSETCFVTVLNYFMISSIPFDLIRNNGRVAVADTILRKLPTRQPCFLGLHTRAGCSHPVAEVEGEAPRHTGLIQGRSLHCRLRFSVWFEERIEDPDAYNVLFAFWRKISTRRGVPGTGAGDFLYLWKLGWQSRDGGIHL